MSSFLYLTGLLLWMASVIISIIYSSYGLIIFPVVFALGCINIGIGRIIDMLQEIKSKQS